MIDNITNVFKDTCEHKKISFVIKIDPALNGYGLVTDE